jgi:hypothetical protein
VRGVLDGLVADPLLDGVEIPSGVDEPADVRVARVVDPWTLVEPGLAAAGGNREWIDLFLLSATAALELTPRAQLRAEVLADPRTGVDSAIAWGRLICGENHIGLSCATTAADFG